jgi:hypothetical protein
MMTFRELADGALADLLKKYGRPVDLRAALRIACQYFAELQATDCTHDGY